jgi:MFS family permease
MSGAIAAAGWLSGGPGLSVACFMLALFLYALVITPLYATALLLAPIRMRSTSVAIFNASITVVGGTLGPLLTGLLSDAWHPMAGVHSLALALTAASGTQVVGALILGRAAYTFSRNRKMESSADTQGGVAH